MLWYNYQDTLYQSYILVLYVYYILVWWLQTKMNVVVKGITNYILIARLNLA